MPKENDKKPSRHARYKVGTCKITFTTDNEDKLRVDRRAINRGYKDSSAFLRELVHKAVRDEPLTEADYEKLKEMRKSQEV